MQYRLLIICLLIFSNIFVLKAQEEWVVPDDKKSKLSPFEFTEEINNFGAEIYSANCKSCHGEPGKNNFVPLVPSPGDPASTDFQSNTDGDFYHKIRTGKGAMPSFNNTLAPNDVWNVICYIRSHNNSYVQEVAKEIQRGVYNGKVSIQLTYLEDKNLIEAKVFGTNENNSKPIADAEIKLFAERYFGNLQIDEDKLTNKEGIALFAITGNLPGDAEGNVKLLAQLSDQEAFGVIITKAVLPVGKATHVPSLVAERAMWNKMSKAPIWVLLSYSLAVLAAWGTIFFVLFQLKRIFIIGNENIE